jgi:glycosyltransferase involved in cell wall biosynthesis
MKISVIISTYNRPSYLKRSLDGFLKQSHLPDEIVIADDGSSEETTSLIDTFRKDVTKINILHIWHEDIGFRLSQIRNRAISRASGTYIIICDDDIIPGYRFVQDHLKYGEDGYFIQGHRVLLGVQASEQFTFKDFSLPDLFKFLLKGQVHNISNALRFPLPMIRLSRKLKGIKSCNMSFFKKDFIAINGFNEDFTGWGKEDSELAVRFYKYGLKRKDIKYRACCIHLYHTEYSRENLRGNIALLDRAISSNEFFCKNGLDKYII